MAIMIPSRPRDCTEESRERELFESLSKLPDSYYVFHSFTLVDIHNNEMEQRETDFIVFEPTRGLLCIEAKAGHVYFDRGEWKYQNGTVMRHGGPFRQAEDNKYLLMERAEKNPQVRSFYKNCKFLSAVWFPSIDNDELSRMDFHSHPSDREELVLTKNDLDNPEPKLKSIFSIKIRNVPDKSLTREEAEKFLNSFLCPVAKVVPTASFALESKNEHFVRLLKEQAMVLDFLEGQKSVAINGGAGTGKTLIAVEKAKRLAAQEERVLFLCVNSALKNHLERTYPSEYIHYSTFANYVCELTSEKDGRKYKEKIPESIHVLENYYENVENFKYKHIIVDEGQDFGKYNEEDTLKERFIKLLFDIVIDNDIGTFYIFYDGMQLIQASELPTCITEADSKITLYKNCRNTKNIAKTSLGAISNKKETKRRFDFIDGCGDGEQPKMYFTIEANLKNSLDSVIRELKENSKYKFADSDIVILSCKGYEKSYLKKNNLLNEPRRGVYHYKDIEFSTCRKFKGLESNAVILIDVDKKTFSSNTLGKDGEDEKQVFYVGTSRAKIALRIIATLSEEECREILESQFQTKARKPQKEFAEKLKCRIGNGLG